MALSGLDSRQYVLCQVCSVTNLLAQSIEGTRGSKQLIRVTRNVKDTFVMLNSFQVRGLP